MEKKNKIKIEEIVLERPNPEPVVVGGNGRKPPKGNNFAENYCNWEQSVHEKAEHVKSHTKSYDKGSNDMYGRTWTANYDGRLGRDFLLAFAKAGGRIENGMLKIAASKFDTVKRLLEKVEKERLTIVGIEKDPCLAAQLDINAGTYCKKDYCKSLHEKGGSPNPTTGMVALELPKLDKNVLKKVAEAGGILEGGRIFVEESRYDALIKELGEK